MLSPDTANALAFMGAGVLGLLFGSFASLIAYRLPRDEKLIAGRSRCRDCRQNLTARDLVPVFSYLTNRGRCRHCGAPVSIGYPLTEIATAVLFMLIYGGVGFTLPAIPLALLAVGLIILTLIDLAHLIIPDPLSVALGGLALLFHLVSGHGVGQAWDAGLGAVLGFAIAWGLRYAFKRLKGKEALGFGDVKFFAVAGLWCGLSGLADFMMLSGLAGIVFAGVWRWRGGGAEFPFGPALAAGLFAVVMLQAAGWPHPLGLLMIR